MCLWNCKSMKCDMNKCFICFCLLRFVTSHFDPNCLFVQVRMDWALTQEESNLPIFCDEVPPLKKKKKKSELVEKLNANTKLLLEMKADLERIKTNFYSRAPAQGFHEEQAGCSGAVDLSGGRDTAPVVEAEEGRWCRAPTKAIDSEEILGDATNEIDVGVEVVVPSKMESCDIVVASPCKTGAGEGSPDVGHFGIEEPEKSAEGGPSAEEEKIAEEPKDVVDCNLSKDDMIIVEALAFVSQQIGDVEADNTSDRQMSDEEGHDSLEEVTTAMLNEEKVNDHILTSKERRNFAPREWIDNMSIFFAATTFMFKEKCETGSISRVIFSLMYTDKVIRDCAKRKVMAPVLHDNHWWCYALDWESKKLFDCGIMVLKYMKHWEATKTYNGQSMPTYSGAELQQFRQDYIIDWVMDPHNIHRDDVLYAIQYTTYAFPSAD
ncbi:hypothetical protein DEO72_LG5g2420 [Vigna unguiculata]|uniref:Ulp1 protease family n=1 Tax=Vigna unguiculata TaxID=3917 RepID=A0A4D6M0C8_VIGUN|nr:hypothetical protein DEO72_LG5g2420 [Vigna unguiculata]